MASDILDYHILHLPHDPSSITLHLPSYKSFRLFSLQTSPRSFGSTHARELAFSDEEWSSRLTNPAANTFTASASSKAQENENGSPQTLCSNTILGPLPYSPTSYSADPNPWNAISQSIHTLTDRDLFAAASRPLHFRINGVFTHPSARGKGLAKKLIDESLSFAKSWAAERGEGEAVVSIIVDSDNPAAVGLYRKAGFKLVKEMELAPREDGSVRDALFMTLRLDAEKF
ncbi:hypothetical protein K402DRAFT_118057 [Aulographum hederae CBS 113979]|uniref:N-acetyltransferase domain-containing protein n=1 Tax=Aulographum hederae CBS 113979 TaxID=1176131 RepID=A0A6G1GWF3_9PEZI|nr:hypothetical protein K402DRAFT_118057 [Aulographum hederae CBS 113979]